MRTCAADHAPSPPTTRRDDGWTLLETLVVVTLLGILAASVVLAVGGMRTDAASSGCDADARILGVAAESYFADQRTDSIAAATPDPADNDRFERTLVVAGLLRAPSTSHDLTADGGVIPEEGSSC